MIVVLTEDQQRIADGYGLLRAKSNRKINSKDNKTKGFSGVSIDALGAAGEFAVSLATGIKWTGRYTPPSKLKEWLSKPRPDLGTDIEVRTRSKDWHQLLIHRNDPPEWRYVLVRYVEPRCFNIVGWEYGRIVQEKGDWNSNLPYPAFVYPTAWLRPIGELR